MDTPWTFNQGYTNSCECSDPVARSRRLGPAGISDREAILGIAGELQTRDAESRTAVIEGMRSIRVALALRNIG